MDLKVLESQDLNKPLSTKVKKKKRERRAIRSVLVQKRASPWHRAVGEQDSFLSVEDGHGSRCLSGLWSKNAVKRTDIISSVPVTVSSMPEKVVESSATAVHRCSRVPNSVSLLWDSIGSLMQASPHSGHFNKHSLLPEGTAHTRTNHPHFWPGEVPVTHTETPDKGQNINHCLSEKRQTFSLWWVYFFFFFFTMWGQRVHMVQLLSHVRLFVTPWLQHTRLPCPSLSPAVC